MKKLLSILGSVGMIGTAGATVVACGNETKAEGEETEKLVEIGKNELNEKTQSDEGDSPTIIAKKALQAKINEAQKLYDEYEKEAWAAVTFRREILEARRIFGKAGMTEKDYIEATATLQAAIEKFKAAKTAVEVARELLKKKITKAEELVQKAEKVESAVKALKSTLEEAKVVWADQNLSEIQLHYATMVLQSAIFNYLSAENKNK